MIIAITGYIGSGKTTVAKLFAEHGFKIIDVDALAHELLNREDIKGKLMAEFGLEILDRNLQVDRHQLAKIVFNDETKLQRLNHQLHPELEKQAKKLLMNETNAVVDVALLEELHLREIVGRVVLVACDIETIYQRLEGRYTKRQILTIINAQHLPQHYDFVVQNNATLDDLRKEVQKIIAAVTP